MNKTVKKPVSKKVQCERCEFFTGPHFSIVTYKFTPAKCAKNLKLYFIAASAFAEDRGMRGYVRVCNKFKELKEKELY